MNAFKKNRFVVLAFILFTPTAFCDTPDEGVSEPCKQKYANLEFSDADMAIFEHLEKLTDKRKEFTQSVAILFGLSEFLKLPTKPDIKVVLRKIAINKATAVEEDAVSEAYKAVVQISALETFETLELILTNNAGKVDPKFAKYRPSGDVRRLLECLHKRFYRLMQEGK